MVLTTNYVADLGNVFVSYSDVIASQPIATLVYTGQSSTSSINIDNISFNQSSYYVPTNTNVSLIVNKVGYQVSGYTTGENTFFYDKGTYSIISTTSNTTTFIIQSVIPFYDTSGSTINTGIYDTSGTSIGKTWSQLSNSYYNGTVVTSNNNVFQSDTSGNTNTYVYYNTVNNKNSWSRAFGGLAILNTTAVSYNGTWIAGIYSNTSYRGVFYVSSTTLSTNPFNYSQQYSLNSTSYPVSPYFIDSIAVQENGNYLTVMIGFNSGQFITFSFLSTATSLITPLLQPATIVAQNTYVSMSASAQYRLAALAGSISPAVNGSIYYVNTMTTSTTSFLTASLPVGTYYFTSICMSALSQYAVASTSNAGCLISKNYGATWTALTIPTYTIFTNISISYNGQNIIATGNTGATYYTYYSSNYGVTFTLSLTSGNFVSSCMSPTGLYAVASGPNGVSYSFG